LYYLPLVVAVVTLKIAGVGRTDGNVRCQLCMAAMGRYRLQQQHGLAADCLWQRCDACAQYRAILKFVCQSVCTAVAFRSRILISPVTTRPQPLDQRRCR